MDEYYIEGIIDSMIDDINYVKIRMSTSFKHFLYYPVFTT